jgi:hypothetical protein
MEILENMTKSYHKEIFCFDPKYSTNPFDNPRVASSCRTSHLRALTTVPLSNKGCTTFSWPFY